MPRGWIIALLGLLSALSTGTATACTTAVISGRATADGRPLLWKNRDAKSRQNEVVYLGDGRFACVAVADAGNTSNIWMGVNTAGLCVENSLSRDLHGETGRGDGNGRFMRRILQTCATVADVKQLLERTDATGRATQANIGVIDATGGACLFETGPHTHRMFDANDPAIAPAGYIVRSNFATTAQTPPCAADVAAQAGVYSGERYLRGCGLIDRRLVVNRIDLPFVLRHLCRDLADPAGQAYPGSVNGTAGTLPVRIDTTATICRGSTVSAAVFQGIKPGEDPRCTTMWVLLGDPAFSVAVPCWAGAGEVAEELDGPKVSRFCTATLALRNQHYTPGAHELRADRLPAVWQRLWTQEDAVLRETTALLDGWRVSPPSRVEQAEAHSRLVRHSLKVLEQASMPPQPPILESQAAGPR